MRDHGGNLDQARAQYGGDRSGWIDLSTGINPRPYPLPQLSERAWADLPTRSDIAALSQIAARRFCTDAPCLPLAGAQAAIQLVPMLRTPGRACILGPTYNEHAASLRNTGWHVEDGTSLSDLAGADLAVVVNPNNPTGETFDPKALLDLSKHVGVLIVDESFTDPHPELSLATMIDADTQNIVILRSFGKFFGLAGLRLGFAISSESMIEKLRGLCGPWPVSGAAIEIGMAAYRDTGWHAETIARLAKDAERLDKLATRAGWTIAGGTTLFRLYNTPDAAQAQERLAQRHIWSRIFPYSKTWIRLGLPDGDDQWARIEAALA